MKEWDFLSINSHYGDRTRTKLERLWNGTNYLNDDWKSTGGGGGNLICSHISTIHSIRYCLQYCTEYKHHLKNNLMLKKTDCLKSRLAVNVNKTTLNASVSVCVCVSVSVCVCVCVLEGACMHKHLHKNVKKARKSLFIETINTKK